MILSKKLCVILSAVVMSGVRLAYAGTTELKDFNVCSEAGYVPFEMVDAEGKWDGYEIKILEKFAKDNNYKLKLKNMAYDGLIPSLLARKDCDLIASTLAVNMERGESVQFSKPILITNFSALVRSQEKDTFDTFAKINQKTTKMAVQNGTEDDNYVKKYAPNVKVLGYSNNVDPVIAVLVGKADIYIEDIHYLKLMKKKYGARFSLLDPKILPHNPDVAIAFAMRKTDKNLIDQMDHFLEKISKNGALTKLQNDYFEDLVWIKRFPL